MKKPVIALIVSMFAFATAHSFAASPLKLEPLTTEQRAEMHNRADSLIAARAAAPTRAKTGTKAAPKATKGPAI